MFQASCDRVVTGSNMSAPSVKPFHAEQAGHGRTLCVPSLRPHNLLYTSKVVRDGSGSKTGSGNGSGRGNGNGMGMGMGANVGVDMEVGAKCTSHKNV